MLCDLKTLKFFEAGAVSHVYQVTNHLNTFLYLQAKKEQQNLEDSDSPGLDGCLV